MQPHSLAETARKGKKQGKTMGFTSIPLCPFINGCHFSFSICDMLERLCWNLLFKLSRQHRWHFIHPLATHRIVNIQFKQRILWFSRTLKPFHHFCYVTKMEFIESVKCPSPAAF